MLAWSQPLEDAAWTTPSSNVICVTQARRGDTDYNQFHSDCYVALRRYLLPAASQGILIKPERDFFHTDESNFSVYMYRT